MSVCHLQKLTLLALWHAGYSRYCVGPTYFVFITFLLRIYAKIRFLRFLFWSRFLRFYRFLIFQTFLFKKRWQSSERQAD